MKINAEEIKVALLSKYRYKLQNIAADEVSFTLGNTDISVFSDNLLTEVEVKISKSDLWHGERAKSTKHHIYKTLQFIINNRYYSKGIIPNYFYLCVPTELLDEAKKWVSTINEKYGILEYRTSKKSGAWTPRPEDMIYVSKRAKLLHNTSVPTALNTIARRLSSANIILKTRLYSLVDDYNKIYKELIELRRKQNGRRT